MQLSFFKDGVRKGILIISCSILLKILPLLPMGHLSVERWYTPKPTSHFSDIQFGQLTFLSQWHVSRSDVCHFQQKVFRILMEHTAMWPFFLWQGQQCPKYEDSISLSPRVKNTSSKPIRFSSVQSLRRVWLFATPWITAHQASLSITNSLWHAGVYSNSCPLSRWCHPTISSSVVRLSSRLQSFPASGSFPMSHFFASGGQSIGASALASVLPMNIQDWFPLGWTGWISLQPQGLSRAFSDTTGQKHQFFADIQMEGNRLNSL